MALSTVGSTTVTATVTDEHGHFTKLAPIPTGATTAVRDAIEIDTKKSRQSVLGFGAAFTDAACYMISRLP